MLRNQRPRGQGCPLSCPHQPQLPHASCHLSTPASPSCGRQPALGRRRRRPDPSPAHLPLLLLLASAAALLLPPPAAALNFNADHATYRPAPLSDTSWYFGSATYYNLRFGDCGFTQDFLNMVYPAAVPLPRFSDTKTYSVPPFLGAACGQCYAVRCANIARYAGQVYCKRGNPQIIVTVVDYDVPKSPPWPLNHFDLSYAGFNKIANPKAGIINIEWRRVPCGHKHAAWKLGSDSNPWYSDIIVEAVPKTGNVVKVYVLVGRSWKVAKHLWGGRWSFAGKATPGSKIMAVLSENRGVVYPVHSSHP